jgi:hypothetical protein
MTGFACAWETLIVPLEQLLLRDEDINQLREETCITFHLAPIRLNIDQVRLEPNLAFL